MIGWNGENLVVLMIFFWDCGALVAGGRLCSSKPAIGELILSSLTDLDISLENR